MLKFKATDKQLMQLAANAVNASTPMGLGVLHYEAGQKYTPIEFQQEVSDHGLDLDYVDGRMVKLWVMRDGDGWRCAEGVKLDYQSWGTKYPTYRKLLESAGITEIEEVV